MANYDSSLTGAQIENALTKINGLMSVANNGKILTVADGVITAKSAIEIQGGSIDPLTVTDNGTYTHAALGGYSPIVVNVPRSTRVEPITITENGTYNPTATADGFAPIVVNVSGSARPFAFLYVVYQATATSCTVSCGGNTMTAQGSSGFYMFYIPSAGTWTVTITNGVETYSKNVSITVQNSLYTVSVFFKSDANFIEKAQSYNCNVAEAYLNYTGNIIPTNQPSSSSSGIQNIEFTDGEYPFYAFQFGQNMSRQYTHMSSSTELTIGMRFRIPNLESGATYPIFSIGVDGYSRTNGLSIRIKNGYLSLASPSDSFVHDTSISISIDTWYTIAASFSNSYPYLQVYFNGTEVQNDFSSVTNHSPIKFHAYPWSDTGYGTMYYRGLFIAPSYLTAEQIQSIFDSY